MKILFSLLIFVSFVFAGDATIEVIKKADTIPSIAVEDSSDSYDETFKRKFFRSLVADLNVLSIFNVDRHHTRADYNEDKVVFSNKEMDYVLRYRLIDEDSDGLSLEMKLLHKNENIYSKSYHVSKKEIYMFVSHAIAYDINEFMGQPSVAWMKRKVVFSRIVAPMKSEIVISDYTLTYQHVVLKGGFNIFPKWASRSQKAFYYTDLSNNKPTLKRINITNGQIKSIVASDGMIVCSDVNDDGTKLLLTMARNGQPDIYSFNTTTNKYKRLTTYSGIDVNGQFFGNNKIVFISSRLGYPNVFSKNLKTNEVEQLVYYGRSNSACSAHGNYVVYKARETSNAFSQNTFNLHLISTNTDFIRRLTATGVNEFPRFSKDGDAIIFIKNYKGQSAIGIIRLNYNKNYLFPLKYGRLQSMDW